MPRGRGMGRSFCNWAIRPCADRRVSPVGEGARWLAGRAGVSAGEGGHATSRTRAARLGVLLAAVGGGPVGGVGLLALSKAWVHTWSP